MLARPGDEQKAVLVVLCVCTMRSMLHTHDVEVTRRDHHQAMPMCVPEMENI